MKNNAESMICAAILQQQEEVRQRLSAVPEEVPSPELEARLAGLQKKMVRRQFFMSMTMDASMATGASNAPTLPSSILPRWLPLNLAPRL